MDPVDTGRRKEHWSPVLIGGLAAVLLFWNLGDRYLWQDEAATAVLAQRMLRFGRPMAYDGVNLITLDVDAASAPGMDERTGDPRAAIDYLRRAHAFKADTTWKWQPWGLFVPPAASFLMLGPTTFAARLPFALAGLGTVLLLFRLARRYGGGTLVASLAALLLALNPYWILHARQCRYSSLSSLFLVATLLGYVRWQTGRRWGAAAFVAAAWCWFQVDYGTVWPVFAVLFADAFLGNVRDWWRTLRVGVVLAAALAPFVYYYELWRRGNLGGIMAGKFSHNLFNVNEYVVPVVILLAAVALLAGRWKQFDRMERRLVGVCCAMVAAMVVWVPEVSEYAFVRYVTIVAPAGALLTAWLLVRGLGARAPRLGWLGLVVLVATPWLSLPVRPMAPAPEVVPVSFWVREEWGQLYGSIFLHLPDPNRTVIEWLRRNAKASDEILINYEDVPLMFYLPNPIRGGIAAFRVEDDARTPPRFVVLRESAAFVREGPYRRELARYQWAAESVHAPDVPWGNNPDPTAQGYDPREAEDLFVARRVGR